MFVLAPNLPLPLIAEGSVELTTWTALASASAEMEERFAAAKRSVLRMLGQRVSDRRLEVLDIGCEAGTQAITWGRDGHSVHARNVNEPLLERGRERTKKAEIEVDCQLGSAIKTSRRDGPQVAAGAFPRSCRQRLFGDARRAHLTDSALPTDHIKPRCGDHSLLPVPFLFQLVHEAWQREAGGVGFLGIIVRTVEVPQREVAQALVV